MPACAPLSAVPHTAKPDEGVTHVCSAFESTLDALKQPTIRVVAVIAEGVPERDTKTLIAYARVNNKIIIGPATVGGMQVGSPAARRRPCCPVSICLGGCI